jgi:hypothetical protein
MSKLFKIFVRPVLEFAHPVWFPDRLQDLEVYERVQRRFTRWCFGYRRPSYSDRLSIMNLISLSNRRLRGDPIYTFKVLKLGGDVTFFELRRDDRLRGLSGKISYLCALLTTGICFLYNLLSLRV